MMNETTTQDLAKLREFNEGMEKEASRQARQILTVEGRGFWEITQEGKMIMSSVIRSHESKEAENSKHRKRLIGLFISAYSAPYLAFFLLPTILTQEQTL